ncbi:MAG: hypothetical protein LBI11_03910 [Streptococcaceae bacterium]|jgi:hypothetical protein|nr:hypothetical protein [Streptococcaceae bacterium]
MEFWKRKKAQEEPELGALRQNVWEEMAAAYLSGKLKFNSHDGMGIQLDFEEANQICYRLDFYDSWLQIIINRSGLILLNMGEAKSYLTIGIKRGETCFSLYNGGRESTEFAKTMIWEALMNYFEANESQFSMQNLGNYQLTGEIL